MKIVAAVAAVLLGTVSVPDASALVKVRVTFTHVNADSMDDPPVQTGEMYVIARMGGVSKSLRLSHCDNDGFPGGTCIWPQFLGFNQFLEFDVPDASVGTVDIDLDLFDVDDLSPDDHADLVNGPEQTARIRVNLITSTWEGINGSFPYRAFQPFPGPEGAGCGSAGSPTRLCWTAEATCASGEVLACTTPLRECDAQPGERVCGADGRFGACIAQALNDPKVCPKPACRGGGRDIDDDGNGNRDNDGDGLFDCWETQRGIDYDGNGTTDLPLPTAVRDHKNLYLEYDFMQFHEPLQASIDAVTRRFGETPNVLNVNGTPTNILNNPDGANGVIFTVERGEQLTHTRRIAFLSLNCTRPTTNMDSSDFDTLKAAFFGTPQQRMSTPAMRAKRFVYRYAIFGHDLEFQPGNVNQDGTSGCAEISGNDFVVTHNWDHGCATATPPTCSIDDMAGTVMHELGHTLGLRHGGNENDNCKPNYFSVMNYYYQWNGQPAARPLDYSFGLSSGLLENILQEPNGVGSAPFRPFQVAFGPAPVIARPIVPAGINWSRNLNAMGADIIDPNVLPNAIDLNSGRGGCVGNMRQDLNDFNDWANIAYDISATREGSDGAPRQEVAVERPFDTRDRDGDGIPDMLDNCPGTANASQADANGDRIGDACEVTPVLECVDADAAGGLVARFGYDNPRGALMVPVGAANRMSPGSEDQGQGFEFFPGRQHGVISVPFTDSVTWTFGRRSVTARTSSPRCAGDRDGDGVPDHRDNCPTIVNPGQADANGDGIGDACPLWKPGVSYAVGRVVVHNGLDYRCRQAHQSQTGWEPPNTYALWERVNTFGIWAPQVVYKTGDEVTHQGVRYRCLQGHQSLPSWTPPATAALWQRL